MKKLYYVLFVATVLSLSACNSSEQTGEEKETQEQEEEKVEDLLKSDQEKADSVKRALGIE